jgi:nickel-dependent lactate racemase
VDELVEAVIRTLLEAGVDADGISILGTGEDVETGRGDPCALLPEPLRDQIKPITHDPSDTQQMAYLAAAESGEPIAVNRALHEADLVLPIGCLRSHLCGGYFGIHTALFPGFSDEKTRSRFRSAATLDTKRPNKRKLVEEAEHVAWLLGINFTIQVVPSADSSILHVLAGKGEAVGRMGRELYDLAWSRRVAQKASLVVAAIRGDDGQQTWENFGRATTAAACLVEEGGAIVVCCDLAASPGPAMQRLIGSRSPEAALRRIRKERPDDALPAAQLASALQRGKVYLLSRLDPEIVEALDITPIVDGAELGRLARQHKSCILLENAPYVVVSEP